MHRWILQNDVHYCAVYFNERALFVLVLHGRALLKFRMGDQQLIVRVLRERALLDLHVIDINPRARFAGLSFTSLLGHGLPTNK